MVNSSASPFVWLDGVNMKRAVLACPVFLLAFATAFAEQQVPDSVAQNLERNFLGPTGSKSRLKTTMFQLLGLSPNPI